MNFAALGEGGVRQSNISRPSKGFTLVEAVVVMVIVGIVAITGFSRFSSATSFHERGFTNEVLSAIHYAHRLASAGGCHLRVQMGGGNLTVSNWPACLPADHSVASTAIAHPQYPGTFVRAVPAGLSVGTLDIYFDGRGRPYTTSSETLTTTVSTLAIGGRSLSIEPQSGYAYE